MAKNLFEVVESLFLPFVFLSFFCASAVRSNSAKIKSLLCKTLAVLAVLVLALSFLREKRLIKYNQINNIYLLVLSIIFGLAFAVFSWIRFHRAKNTQINKTEKESVFEILAFITGLLFVSCNLFHRVPVIFSLPFHFLGMYDTYFSTMYLAKCSGYFFGWIVCFLCALAVYKVISRSSEKTNALVFTLLYLNGAFISFVSIVGIINSYYRRKIKIPAGLRKSLPQLISAENLIFFVPLIVILILAVVFFIHYTKIHGEYSNPAEHRKLKAFSRNNRRWATFLFVLSLFVWTDVTLIKKIANTIVELSPSEDFKLENGEIYIPLEQVADGHLHRFTWTNDAGKGIRFIIVQKKGMSFGVGFDACDVCGDVGYYERKDEVVCNRCDVVMNKSTIGLKGGCNPVPLDSRIENGGIIILTEDLQKEAHRFKN